MEIAPTWTPNPILEHGKRKNNASLKQMNELYGLQNCTKFNMEEKAIASLKNRWKLRNMDSNLEFWEQERKSHRQVFKKQMEWFDMDSN
ncbi:hypothetical protein AVEN_25449-1 [Araneus ventricosus]|uniref:Uncharacterized protein n=1 Tax=Araneus ventricosus TaxID=182803 RepID=A0A4Y2QT34_ARAVE|nr:hypothetical protein AVEN_25449-1 [Araneus ventricosus]